MAWADRAAAKDSLSPGWRRNPARVLAALAAGLGRDRSMVTLLLASFSIGVVYCLWVFDVGFLAGSSGFWVNSRGIRGIFGADLSTALSGYYFFVRGSWQLPLFHVDQLGAPRGIAIIFTDSIPVLAVVGRLIYRLTGEIVNLFGWWTASCFILLGMSLTGLVAALGQRSILPAVAATVIGLCMPPLLWRWGNPALMAQFEIVLALVYYFACAQRRYFACTQRRSALFRLGWGAPLLILALWTNPYIFVAVGSVVVAATGQALVDRKIAPRAGCAALAVLAALVVAVMALSGYLSVPGSANALGFGYYSMNLLSPVTPQMSGLIPGARSFVLDATGGQYEGFSYLGGGVLLLLLAALHVSEPSSLGVLRAWRRGLGRAWHGHACLLVVLLGLAGLAFSNTVFVGRWNVAAVPLPAWLLQMLGVFRSSGRFFWPALYTIAALAIAAAASRYRRTGAAMLLAACVLQWLDTAPLRGAVASSAATGAAPLIDVGAWRRAVSRHGLVRIVPSFACLNAPPYTWTWSRQVAVQLQLVAGVAGVATNTVYAGRGSSDCAGEAQSPGAASDPVRGELAVYLSEWPGFATLQQAAGRNDGPCRASPRLVVCSRDIRQLDPQSLLAARPAE